MSRPKISFVTSEPADLERYVKGQMCPCEFRLCRTIRELARCGILVYLLATRSDKAELDTITVNLPEGAVEFIMSAKLEMSYGSVDVRFNDAEGLAAVKEAYGYESKESTGHGR